VLREPVVSMEIASEDVWIPATAEQWLARWNLSRVTEAEFDKLSIQLEAWLAEKPEHREEYLRLERKLRSAREVLKRSKKPQRLHRQGRH
jgi:ferric-dicitrate binding protein FerR (iron transport regulator)